MSKASVRDRKRGILPVVRTSPQSVRASRRLRRAMAKAAARGWQSRLRARGLRPTMPALIRQVMRKLKKSE